MPWRIETALLSHIPSDIQRVKQEHSGTIVWVGDITPTTVADGIAVRASFAEPFMIQTADCLPLVLLSEKVACALHVSRKTLIRGLLDRVPRFMDPVTIAQVHVGPHICAQHFVFETVGKEIEAFCEAFPSACEKTPEGTSLSITEAVNQYLKKWGVAEALITQDGRCTFEATELPSYRRAWLTGQPRTDDVATIVVRA